MAVHPQPAAHSANAKFYTTYALAHLVGAALVLGSVDLVNLAVDVEVMNALLLPIVLGQLLVREARALCLVVIAFGLYMVPQALGWT
ncbi:hypothetical protein LAUMK4_02571 [Mycobacterium persicum]|uniref:Uncharacterized protein n=1 Tax=Mycobacterium persicum TaxID=1487726 RepID=A0AB38V1A2_9MYCO|nr:hypothetical protein LAUMK15_02896 [Mycobacterium persicum]VAZ86657.1 hypothetical protein LAUMK42_05510 [Mycobacterium persicum]VAZ93745.1 hypothetical protein LAUMK4_02571 [Mycobacterium persicum]